MTDRYPLKVPIKGDFVQWAPRKIWFTSNLPPHEWYQIDTDATRAAYFRRFTRVIHFGCDVMRDGVCPHTPIHL